MSDDLNKKMKQLSDVLGQDNLQENLMGLLSLLLNPGNKDETQEKTQEQQAQEKAPAPKQAPALEKPARSDVDETTEMLRKAKKVMDKLSTNSDPRVNLLNAIGPFLNKSRQKKLGNCIKMLQMANLSGFLEDSDK